jgi:hypothetical protein
MFNVAIFPPNIYNSRNILMNEDNYYQLAGRLCGYKRNHQNYSPIIYTTDEIMLTLLSLERKAENVAKHGIELGLQNNVPFAVNLETFNNI